MGRVYMCHDTEDGHVFGLKTLCSDLENRKSARLRFLSEADTWISIGSHPNIVQAANILKCGEKQLPCLKMQWVFSDPHRSDATLHSRIKSGNPWPVARSLKLAMDVARAMDHACSAVPGLVHRDLKPNNILVDVSGNALVTDFGVATSEWINEVRRSNTPDPGSTLEKNVGLAGTPRYRSPEQWLPDCAIDLRADIYSLGCILFQMLTGSPAAGGKELEEIKSAHLTGVANQIPAHFPESIAELLRSMLATDRIDRPGSWKALLSHLEAVWEKMVGRPVPEQNDTPTKKALKKGWEEITLAQSYIELGNSAIANRHLLKAWDIAKTEMDTALKVTAEIHLARLKCEYGEFEQGKLELESLINSEHVKPLSFARLQGITIYASLLANHGKFNECKYWVEKIQHSDNRHSDSQIQFSVEQCQGLVSIAEGDGKRALHHFNQCLNLARESKNGQKLAQTYNNIAATELTMGNPNQCLEASACALEHAQSVCNDDVCVDIYMNAGKAYNVLNRPKQAEEYFSLACSLAEGMDKCARIAAIKNELGQIKLNSGDYMESIGYFQSAMATSKDSQLGNLQFSATVGLGSALCQTGVSADYKKGKNLLHEARALLQPEQTDQIRLLETLIQSI